MSGPLEFEQWESAGGLGLAFRERRRPRRFALIIGQFTRVVAGSAVVEAWADDYIRFERHSPVSPSVMVPSAQTVNMRRCPCHEPTRGANSAGGLGEVWEGVAGSGATVETDDEVRKDELTGGWGMVETPHGAWRRDFRCA